MSNLEYQLFYRRHLPHYQPSGATLFVTFRLAGSIPAETMRQLLAEAEGIEAILAAIADPQERAQRAYLEQRRLFGKWDTALDAAHTGSFWLHDPRIASLVAESIHYRAGRIYELDTFCVMPNHVHLVYTPLIKEDGSYQAMSTIMHSLKLYTSRRVNLLLEREGDFWQHENYDHVIRDEAERQRIILYVINNPVKAGLVHHWQEWPWTYCKYPL